MCLIFEIIMVKRESGQDHLVELKKYLTSNSKPYNPTGISVHDALEYLADVNNVWGVHFTGDNPVNISKKGFRYGTRNLEEIHRTRPAGAAAALRTNERRPGFNFGYEEGNPELDSVMTQKKYGSKSGDYTKNDEYRAVAFLTKKGILIRHNFDKENQLVFWGSDILSEDIFPLVYLIKSRKWYIPVERGEMIEAGPTVPEALKYIKKNERELRLRLKKSVRQSPLETKVTTAVIALFVIGIILQGVKTTGFAVNNNFQESLSYSSLSLILIGFIIMIFYFFIRKK
jgi:hypothetical protein